MQTTLLKCNFRYPSGRIYPGDVVNEAVKEFNKEHPEGMSLIFRDAAGNLEKVGKVTDLHINEEAALQGTVAFEDTPKGNELKNKTLSVDLMAEGDWDFVSGLVRRLNIINSVITDVKEG